MSAEIDIDFLFRAVESNEPIALQYATESDRQLDYHSRFFRVNRKKKYIIIDKPTGEKDTYQQLAPGDIVTVFFRSAGFRFLFKTKILKKGTFKLHGKHVTPVLMIYLPDEIDDGERRNFFRVPMPRTPQMTVKFISYFEQGQNLEQQQDKEMLGDYPMSEGIILDLSGGGIAIKCSQDSTLMVGDIINMKFQLPSLAGSDIEISGVINNSRKIEDELVIRGIEFIPNSGDAYKNALKNISSYVMRRQREMIRAYRK